MALSKTTKASLIKEFDINWSRKDAKPLLELWDKRGTTTLTTFGLALETKSSTSTSSTILNFSTFGTIISLLIFSLLNTFK